MSHPPTQRSRLRAIQRRRRRRQAAQLTLVCAGAFVVLVAASVFAYGLLKGSDTGSASVPAETGETATGGPGKEAEPSGEGTSPSRERTGETTAPGTKLPAEMPSPANSCDSLQVLVDPQHPLPATYAPMDLASLAVEGVPTTGADMYVRSAAATNLGDLTASATADGVELVVVSAYRSYAEQQQTFAHYSSIYGSDVEMVSAPPGQSQHQLGTTVDFSNAEVGYQLIPTFGNTLSSRWLEKNAWRFGYINTYPRGDQGGTGRQWEPWEYRFVGMDAARAVQNSEQSLREFLTEGGITPQC